MVVAEASSAAPQAPEATACGATPAPDDARRLSDPRTYARGVPHELFASLRQSQPVAWVKEVPLVRQSQGRTVTVQGSGYWALTRHADVHAAARNPATFSSHARGVFIPDPASQRALARMRHLLINMDEPQHRTTRALVRSAFTPPAVAKLSDSIRVHMSSIATRVLAAPSFDVVTDLAAELPLLVLADLLGVPRSDRHLLFRWSNQLVGFDDPEYGGGDVRRFEDTFVEAFDYVLRLVKRAHHDDGDDLTRRLATARLDGRSLTASELCHFWILLMVAGNETTRHLLSGSLAALLEFPDQRERLQQRPGLIRTAVEELLRWVSPTMLFRRTATRDVEVCGQHISEGDKVVLYFVSANRDERVFTAPERLDLGREPNPHLAFGTGIHHCMGAQLARLEAATMLEVMAPHLHRLELLGHISRLESNFMHGIKSMPARFARE